MEFEIQNLRLQLSQSRAKILEYRMKIIKNQREIKNDSEINNCLSRQLSIARVDLEQGKVDNHEINLKFVQLQDLEQENYSRIREVEKESNTLSNEISATEKEKNEAITIIRELECTI